MREKTPIPHQFLDPEAEMMCLSETHAPMEAILESIGVSLLYTVRPVPKDLPEPNYA